MFVIWQHSQWWQAFALKNNARNKGFTFSATATAVGAEVFSCNEEAFASCAEVVCVTVDTDWAGIGTGAEDTGDTLASVSAFGAGLKRKPDELDVVGTLKVVATGVVVQPALGTENTADGMEAKAGGAAAVVELENVGTGTENSPWLGVVDVAKDGVDFDTVGAVAGAKEKAFPPPLAPNEKTLPPVEPNEKAVVADEAFTDENSDGGATVLPEEAAAATGDVATGTNEVLVEKGWLVKGGNPAAPALK